MDNSMIYSMLEAASSGELSYLTSLTDDCPCDFTDTTGKSALCLATERGNAVAVGTLLKAGADVNKTYCYRRTPLMFAADKGCTECLQTMLETGAKLDSVDTFGMSALMTASQRGYITCLRMLITAGASLHIRDIRGKTALMIAVEDHRCECVKYLLEAGANVKDHDHNGNTPLMTAVLNNCETCMQILVQAGASVDELNAYGKSPLMVAVARESHILHAFVQMGANLNHTNRRGETSVMLAARAGLMKSLPLLIQAGADLNRTNEEGQTALMMAADAGHKECIECLVSGGARQELQDAKGKTALMLTASKGYDECLQVLLQNGARMKDMQCKSGKTALIYAVQAPNETESEITVLMARMNLTDTAGRRTLVSVINNYKSRNAGKCLQILLEAKASPSICDTNGMTPLMHAARLDKSTKFFQPLVEAGADINAADRFGTTALGHSASGGNLEYIRKLVDAGASVNSGESSLIHLAKMPCNSSVCDSIDYLLNHNADVNAQDCAGMTPLMWAAKSSSDTSGMTVLISRGAKINMTDKSGYSALHHTLGHSDELLMNANFLLSKGANPNLRTADGKSSVSLAVRSQNYNKLLLLLGNNAEPCMDWEDFCHLAKGGDRRMLQQMVLCGALPSQVAPHQDKLEDRMTMLMTAVNVGSLAMAKFFLAVGYLSQYDINKRCGCSKMTGGCFRQAAKLTPQMLSFLDSVYSSPWPLVKLSFFAVSSQMGPNPGRKDRVQRSGLPDRLQRMLLFQDPISRLCINHWDSIPFCLDPDDYEKLQRPRPLLFYWPFGQDLIPCKCIGCSQAGFKFAKPQEQ